MTQEFDRSVYPDQPPPAELVTLEQRAEFLERIVGAFDFGIVPDAATRALLRQWKDVFDAFPRLGSPGYHALRTFFGFEQLPREPCFMEPIYLKLDRLEGRIDGCEDWV